MTIAALTLASGFGVAFVAIPVRRGREFATPGAAHRSCPHRGNIHGSSSVGPEPQPSAHTVGTHLTIVPIFGSTVTSSSLSTQIESAFNYVVNQYEAEYSDPITIDVNVVYTGSGLGESSQTLFCDPYSDSLDVLLASQTTPDQITSARTCPQRIRPGVSMVRFAFRGDGPRPPSGQLLLDVHLQSLRADHHLRRAALHLQSLRP